jgi:hypothetical protein
MLYAKRLYVLCITKNFKTFTHKYKQTFKNNKNNNYNIKFKTKTQNKQNKQNA